MKNLIEIIEGVPRQREYDLGSPLNIAIGEGEQIALIGNNGAGKSIAIGALTGAIPLKGEGVKYHFEGRASDNIKYLSFRDSYGTADKGYYHQQRWNSCGREDQLLVRDALPETLESELHESLFKLFGIDRLLDKEQILLSSGELRKFQLTKALLSNPRLLILEDPFIGLDSSTREQLSSLLQDIVLRGAPQLILVLSRQSEIPQFTTHVIEVEGGLCKPKVDYPTYINNYSKDIRAIKGLSEAAKKRIAELPTQPSEHKENQIIELNAVTIAFGEHTILRNLSWQMNQGEQWALSGETGAGKSTLLSLICADIPQGYACDLKLFGRQRGSGESIWDIKRHIGYVSPEMHRAYSAAAPCIEIVASGLHDTVGLYRRMKEDQCAVCEFWLDIFGISHLRDRNFMRISSGEQRLVLLARAFVKDPELLILDEPLHGLDDEQRQLSIEVIESFCRRPNKSLIFVSHYKEELPSTITHSLHLTKV